MDNTGACEVLFSHPSQKNDEKTALASPPLHIQIFLSDDGRICSALTEFLEIVQSSNIKS